MTGTRRGRWWKITLAVVGSGLLLAVFGIWLFFLAATHRAFPDVEGDMIVAGLNAPVEVIRDDMGVAHIYAADPHDLFLAQGYVHAQERFWQMDFWRHLGAGRLSELSGSSQVENDTFLRALGWEDLAEEQYATSTPPVKAALDAYAEGVNAYLAKQSPADLSLEYTFLELRNRSYTPEPWTPTNTLTWGHVMAWDLGGNLDLEIDRALLLGVLSPEQVEQLYPAYPGTRHPYIIEPSGQGQVASLRGSADVETLLFRTQERVDALHALTGGGAESGIGSNSWVVSGALSSTGSPILANDPHLAIQMPSIWYQVGLHCLTVTAECPYNVAGFSFAGVPGVIIGHNDRIAWGVTNMGPDVQDLYIEKINPESPNQYEVNGEWVDMSVRSETIEVAGADSVAIRVRETRHGPIISDTYESLEDFGTEAGIDLPESFAIALRWTDLDVNPGLAESILALNTAQNWEEFRTAAATFAVPAQNMVYADVEGNIGYQAPGNIPIRADGAGVIPVPGWDDRYEWVGFIEFDDLPRVFNPEQGYIATANNAIVGDDYPHLITWDWNYGYRARRIIDLLSSNPRLGLADHGRIQLDDYNLNAERLLPFVQAVPLNGRLEEEARAILAAWDLRNAAESSGAAIFAAFWDQLLAQTFRDDLPEDQWPTGRGRWFDVVGNMVDDPFDPFWDDVTTPQTETRDDIIITSFAAAVDGLASTLGASPEAWRWDAIHRAHFINPAFGDTGIGLVDDRFNRGPVPVAGGADLVNAAGWDATEGFEVDWLPSMRMLVDLGDLANSLAVHTTGQSGHVDHPHYDDMIPLWQEGRFSPMLWERREIERNAESVQVLVP